MPTQYHRATHVCDDHTETEIYMALAPHGHPDALVAVW